MQMSYITLVFLLVSLVRQKQLSLEASDVEADSEPGVSFGDDYEPSAETNLSATPRRLVTSTVLLYLECH